MIRIGPAPIALLGWMAFSVSFALLLPSAAQAESGARGKCLYMDVGGTWYATQSNAPYDPVQFDLRQTGSQIQGIARQGAHLAIVVGTVTGSSLKMTVDWNGYSPFKGEPIGEYTGEQKYGWVGEPVGMNGTTVHVNAAPEVRHVAATWYTNQHFYCAAGAWVPDPSAITPPAVKALGRVNLPPGTALAPPRPICDVAAEARARNSAAAPGLEAQCRAAVKAAADKAEAERKAAVGVVALKDDHSAAKYLVGTPTPPPRQQYPPYGAAYSSNALPASLQVNQTTFVSVTVRNLSSQTWPSGGVFRLAYHWNRRGAATIQDGPRTLMPTAVASGASVTLNAKVIAPPSAGASALTWDMVQENVWFSDKGVAMSAPQSLTVTP